MHPTGRGWQQISHQAHSAHGPLLACLLAGGFSHSPPPFFSTPLHIQSLIDPWSSHKYISSLPRAGPPAFPCSLPLTWVSHHHAQPHTHSSKHLRAGTSFPIVSKCCWFSLICRHYICQFLQLFFLTLSFCSEAGECINFLLICGS